MHSFPRTSEMPSYYTSLRKMALIVYIAVHARQIRRSKRASASPCRILMTKQKRTENECLRSSLINRDREVARRLTATYPGSFSTVNRSERHWASFFYDETSCLKGIPSLLKRKKGEEEILHSHNHGELITTIRFTIIFGSRVSYPLQKLCFKLSIEKNLAT